MLHSSINTIVLTIIFLMKKNNKEKEQREKHMRGSVTKYQKGQIGFNLKSQFSIEFLIYL